MSVTHDDILNQNRPILYTLRRQFESMLRRRSWQLDNLTGPPSCSKAVCPLRLHYEERDTAPTNLLQTLNIYDVKRQNRLDIDKSSPDFLVLEFASSIKTFSS